MEKEVSEQAKLQASIDRRHTLRGGEFHHHPPGRSRAQHQRRLASSRLCLPWSALRAPTQGNLLQVLPHLELDLDKEGH